MYYLKKEKLSHEDDFYLRCCLALFQIYLEFLGNPEEKIKKIWNNNIKPLVLQKYPIIKNGIFNKNADVEFLIQEIDRINNANNNKQEEKSEPVRQSRLNDIRMNTIYVSSKQFLGKGNTKNNENNNNKIKVKNKTVNENTNNKMKNEIVINTSEIKKKESNTMKVKKNDKIYMKSIIITIRNNFTILIRKRKNKSVDERKYRKISLAKSFDLHQYANEVYIKDNDDINNKKKKIILEEKSTKKKMIISSNYVDEISSDKTIRYKNKKLKAISFNFLLKQITSTDFIEKDGNIEFIYSFAQQCFCFVKKENLFQKIFNCYTHYKKLNTPFIHMKKLIYFLNLLILEMYDYHHNLKFSIDKNIKNFYKNLETELKKVSTKNNNNNETKEKETKKLDQCKDQFKDSKAKRASLQFVEKIKMLEELQNKNIHSLMQENKKMPAKKSIKEKPKKIIKEELNEEGLVLNEISLINTLFESKQENNNIEEIKKKLKLYKDYIIKKGEKNKRDKSFIILNRSSLKPSEKKNYRNYYLNYFSILNYEPEEIGEVLISISREDLSKIERRELYNAIFLKKGKEKTCPNITECITKFNKLTSFIMEDILSYDYPKIRAKVIYYWLRVAEYLKQRKDHNDCFAIYSALHHYIITGLQQTKKEMKSKVKVLQNKIRDYCTFDGNYKNFREEMHICSKNEEFFLPYLGLLLRDISFFEANYDYIMDDGLINVEKIEKVQTIIDEFFSFKNMKDNDNEGKLTYPQELNFFKNLEIIKEDDLEILANKLEPKFILKDFPQKGKRITNLDKKFFKYKVPSDNESTHLMSLGSFVIV